jgi:acyl-CoA synthetase (AMP-forming)/AMP-acid ligase II
MLSVKKYFAGSFTKFLDNEVLLDESGVRFKYSDIQTFSSSKFFQALDRKLIICKLTNDAECLALYFALLASGAIPLLTSADIAESEYLKLLKAYQPAAELIPMFEKNHSADYFTHDSITKFSVRTINSDSTSYPINDELALLFPTSGSTGSAKYVRVSHENIISNTDIISSYLQIKEQDKVITTLPPNYSYGASVLHTHLSKGSSIVVTEASFIENKFWKLLNEHKVTTLNGVPFHYEMLKRLKFHKMHLPDLRVLTQAGGHLNSELKHYFINYCIDNSISFYAMYGQTEASPRISYITLPDILDATDSIGKGIANCRLSVVNENNEEILMPNSVGELNVMGKNIAMGYSHTYEDLAKPNEFKGLLKTGDLAYYDENDRFYIVGRMSRFVKIVGKRINLDDVQNIIYDFGYENVCTGDDSLIKIGCTNISPDNKINLIRTLMQILKIPKNAIKIFEIDTIDRTSSGKVAYKENNKKMEALL